MKTIKTILLVCFALFMGATTVNAKKHGIKVLVLCTGNTCRSQMAHGLLESYGKDLAVYSGGVKALMREDAVIRVGCFDTRFYGFHDIHSEQDIEELELRGARGTNFHVAVDAFTGDAENRIIFTDGYAEMPTRRCDAVWVVYGTNPIHPPGGRVIYARPPEEKEKHEITFLIT